VSSVKILPYSHAVAAVLVCRLVSLWLVDAVGSVL
jgi:hypothetical protein